MERLTADPALYARFADAAKRWSATFSFDAAATEMRAVIAGAIDDAKSKPATSASDAGP